MSEPIVCESEARRAGLVAILDERVRNKDLPGSEWDLKNSPNDWVAIADHYLGECVRRGSNIPEADEFRDSLIKAAAVILAALEHIPVMAANGHFATID